MKINNRTVEGVNTDFVVIPRPARYEEVEVEGKLTKKEISQDLVFRVQAVIDFSDFDNMIPAPLPPNTMVPGGKPEPDYNHASYKKAQLDRGGKRIDWIVLKSLEITEGLEWDTVDMSKPETWANYEADLRSAGLVPAEIRAIIDKVLEVNSLTDDVLDKARQRFLAGQGRTPRA